MKETKIITERNINLIKHWIESNEFGLITAFKNVKEDTERNKELMAALLRLGYGVRKVHGAHWENQEETSDQKEYLLVVNSDNKPDFYKNLFHLSEYYNQDSFCYKSKGDSVAYNIGYNTKAENGTLIKNMTNEFMTHTHTALTEEMMWYKNQSLGAKESIAYACRNVIKYLKEKY